MSVAQAARDLGVHETVLGLWVKQASADPKHAFPGQAQMRPEQAEIELLAMHFFNHQTHHRGQVHCMLTQAGGQPHATDLPQMPE